MTDIQPNFFVIGVVKGGTTSLFNYMSQHPEVYLTPIKETNHFSAADMRPELFRHDYSLDVKIDLERYVSGDMSRPVHIAHVDQRKDYARLYGNMKDEKAYGEISTSYCICPSAAAAIAGCSPQARVMVVLRDPAERAFSQYVMNLREGKTLCTDFMEEVERDRQQENKGWGISHQYVELGYYYSQLQRYLKVFSEDQIKVLFFEDLKNNAPGVMKDICQFLGINASYPFDFTKRYNEASLPRSRKMNYLLTQSGIIKAAKTLAPKGVKKAAASVLYSKKNLPSITSKERAFMLDFYREDIQALSDWQDRDLSSWLATEPS